MIKSNADGQDNFTTTHPSIGRWKYELKLKSMATLVEISVSLRSINGNDNWFMRPSLKIIQVWT